MAERLKITMVRGVGYGAGELVQIEVDGVLQPDRVVMWSASRESVGWGRGGWGEGGDGFGHAGRARFGEGVFGYESLGVSGGGLIEHRTVGRFAAGDYVVRLRGVDVVGNAGPWGEAFVVRHRPRPAPPTGVGVSGDMLEWAAG